MRATPNAIASALSSGVTTLAHVWKVVRRDGATFAFTDHDEPLSFDGAVAEPARALRMGAIEKSLDLSVDTASIGGALAADALSEDDLVSGVWDSARVDVFVVDWRQPSQRVHLFSGRIGEVRRGVSAFEAELRGLQAPLNVPVGRVFSRFCDADLGDMRCGKSLQDSAFRGEGVVTAVLSAVAFRASGLSGYQTDWFSRGRVVWPSGVSEEVSAHRSDGAEAIVELLGPPGDGLEVGAAFSVYAGCDKRIETCAGKFSNNASFRGFPHMPGNDAIQSRPEAGARLDGSSRNI